MFHEYHIHIQQACTHRAIYNDIEPVAMNGSIHIIIHSIPSLSGLPGFFFFFLSYDRNYCCLTKCFLRDSTYSLSSERLSRPYTRFFLYAVGKFSLEARKYGVQSVTHRIMEHHSCIRYTRGHGMSICILVIVLMRCALHSNGVLYRLSFVDCGRPLVTLF